MGGKEASSPITIGYHYFLSMHMAVCHGPVDYLKDMRSGDSMIIFGGTDAEAELLRPTNVNTPTAIRISKPNLYGGPKQEGGVGRASTPKNSMVYILWGGEDQPQLQRLKELIIDKKYDNPPITKFRTDDTPIRQIPNFGNSLEGQLKLKVWKDQIKGSTNTFSSVETVVPTTEIVGENGIINWDSTALGTAPTYESTTYTETVQPLTATSKAQEVPAYRRILSIIWDDLHYQTNSSRPKPWNFKVCRIPLRGTTVNGVDVSVITQSVITSQDYFTTTEVGAIEIKKVSDTELRIKGSKVILPANAFDGQVLKEFKYKQTTYARGDRIISNPAYSSLENAPDANDNLNRFWYLTDVKGSLNAWSLVKGWKLAEWNEVICDVISGFRQKSAGVIFPTNETELALAKMKDTMSSSVVEEANPALILAELLVDRTWGLGYPIDMLDLPSFESCAKTLYDEDFGLSAIWENESTVEDFLSLILNTINGVLYVSPLTGKFVLRLIRKVEPIQIADETNVIEMREYTRMATTELTNQISVQWTDPILGSPLAMTVHNPAVFEMQGFTVAITRQYPAVTSHAVATMIAARDLAILSQPLAQVKLVVNREFAGITIGDVIEWHWNDLGIQKMDLRVMGIGHGLLEDGRITLDCIEDIFHVDTSSFVTMRGTQFENALVGEPDAPKHFELVNLNYVDLFKLKTNRGVTTQFDVVDEGSGAIAVFAAAPRKHLKQFDFHARVNFSGHIVLGDSNIHDAITNPNLYRTRGVLDFTPYGISDIELNRTTTVIPLSESMQLDSVKKGSYLYCDGEYMEVVELAQDFTSVTVKRGIISTPAKHHAQGVYLWFYSGILDKVVLDAEWLEGQEIAGTPLTWNNMKLLPLTDALPAKVVAVNTDWVNPYPVANLRVTLSNSVDLRLEWDHRDAALQQDKLVGQTDGATARTPGIYYTYRFVNQDGVLLHENPAYVKTLVPVEEVTSAMLLANPLFIAVKAVQGGKSSEWTWVAMNINTGALVDVATPPNLGTYDPPDIGIISKIVLTVLPDGDFDADLQRYDISSNSGLLTFTTNIDQIFQDEKNFFSELELSQWFAHYKIQVISMNSVDTSGPTPMPRVLGTHITRQNQYVYSNVQNSLDHQNEPDVANQVAQPEVMLRITVVDNNDVESSAKYVTLHFKGITTGTEAYKGIRGDFGTTLPTGILEGDATLRFVKVGMTGFTLTDYPIYKWNKKTSAWEQEETLYDFTKLKLIKYTNTPADSTDDATDNTLWVMKTDMSGFTQV